MERGGWLEFGIAFSFIGSERVKMNFKIELSIKLNSCEIMDNCFYLIIIFTFTHYFFELAMNYIFAINTCYIVFFFRKKQLGEL